MRQGAKVGDVIVATGYLGSSACGLKILKTKSKGQRAKNKKLINSHLLPPVRLKYSREMRQVFQINSMIDISDGLSVIF